MDNPNMLQPGQSLNLISSNGHDEEPVFDFSDMSWKDVRTFDSMNRALNAASTDEDEEAATLKLHSFLARCTVSVPRSWLVKAAPAQLDWTKPESFDFIRFDKVKRFGSVLQESIKVENVSKN